MTTRTAVLSLCTAVGAAGTAHADVSRTHGALCAPKDTSRNLVGVDERGTYNAASAGSALVTCIAPNLPMHAIANQGSFEIGSGVTTLRVWGRDLSTTVPFSCYPFATYDGGFTSWGPTRYMCSQDGGCPDSTSEYTGSNDISWDVASMFGPRVAINGSLGVVCSIPPATSAGSSYVKDLEQDDTVQWTLDLAVWTF